MFPITCLIPCFNDHDGLNYLLAQIHPLGFQRIIVIDDGSNPKVKIPPLKRVSLIRQPSNQGKSAAITIALNQVTTPHILLCDADCIFIDPQYLKSAISLYLQSLPHMLLLRRTLDPPINRLIRTDIVLSGQRLLKTNHLREALKECMPSRFQLELAIITFMIHHHLQVFWSPLPFQDRHKLKKRGLIRGILQEFTMYRDLLLYPPPFNYPRQLLTFAHQKLSPK